MSSSMPSVHPMIPLGIPDFFQPTVQYMLFCQSGVSFNTGSAREVSQNTYFIFQEINFTLRVWTCMAICYL